MSRLQLRASPSEGFPSHGHRSYPSFHLTITPENMDREASNACIVSHPVREYWWTDQYGKAAGSETRRSWLTVSRN